MKHLFRFSLLLLAFVLPATSLAHDFEVDGIYYLINGNNVTVTYKGTSYNDYSDEYSGSVTIPATVTYGGTTYSVTAIGSSAFYNCNGLTSIVIPNSVTKIGDSAFNNCFGLTNVHITDLAAWCGINFESSNSNPLCYAHKLYLNGVEVTELTIPNSVTSIGDYAFYKFNGLTSITIPNSVNTIGDLAFANCGGLTRINVENGNAIYDSRNNCNAIIETATNTLITGCKNTVIPNSVTSIGSRAFYDCSGLTSITIPNSVNTIGQSAFYNCSGLTSITIPNSVNTIDAYAFYNSGLTSLTIPNSVTSIGSSAFDGTAWYDNQPDGLVYAGLVAYKYKGTMPSGTSITLRNGTLGIAGFAFARCTGLTSITIPNSVTTIGEWAFYGCSGLTSIDIPNSVTSIGVGAFYGCSGLTCITLGNSVTSIGPRVFSGCRGLTSIDIPNSIISIGFAAFERCTGLTNVTIGNSVTTIADWTFSGCSGLASVTIPNSVNTIGDLAFYECTGLTSVDIPNSVTSIGNQAFYYCTGLTSVSIGNSVSSIGNYAFYGCNSLTEIYSLALTPPTIGSNTFDSYYYPLFVPDIALDSYTSADYWKEFTNIVGMPYTFEVNGTSYHATSLSAARVIADVEGTLYCGDVVIPDSVTYEGTTFAVTGIEGNAFDGCFELTSITIPNTVESIGEQAFQGCTGLTSVTIGSGVTNIGTKAFNYCNALETVKCIGTVPPVMASADCFSTAAYNRATLLVPRNSEATYAVADYWYKFAHIDGWGSAGRGDIDGDGLVNIADVIALIDAILRGDHEGVYFESADLNSNGRLDISDVTTIIDMLLNGE